MSVSTGLILDKNSPVWLREVSEPWALQVIVALSFLFFFLLIFFFIEEKNLDFGVSGDVCF